MRKLAAGLAILAAVLVGVTLSAGQSNIGGNGSGSSGLSGMTASQVPIAATASTVTSSKAIVGTDAGLASAATISTSAGTAVCSTANGGVTTTGCASGGAVTISGGAAYAYSVSPEFSSFPYALGGATTTITSQPSPVSTGNTIDTLQVQLVPNIAAASTATYTLVYGATVGAMATTTLTCTVLASTGSCTDPTHSFTTAAGGFLSMQITFTGTPGTTISYWSVKAH
jgi:hypothetical protein